MLETDKTDQTHCTRNCWSTSPPILNGLATAIAGCRHCRSRALTKTRYRGSQMRAIGLNSCYRRSLQSGRIRRMQRRLLLRSTPLSNLATGWSATIYERLFDQAASPLSARLLPLRLSPSNAKIQIKEHVLRTPQPKIFMLNDLIKYAVIMTSPWQPLGQYSAQRRFHEPAAVHD